MNIEKIDICELLPQQKPFVMVDRLLYFDEKCTSTQFVVKEDNIFVKDDRLDACALAENIAQTCAARLGYYNKYILKQEIQIGFIGAIKNMKVIDVPRVGDVLDTSIEVLQDVMGITLVDAEIKVKDRVIVTSQMKIALTEEKI
jgi:predicted hotdog family 3-hydroxylacyl-ACP dehydratase